MARPRRSETKILDDVVDLVPDALSDVERRKVQRIRSCHMVAVKTTDERRLTIVADLSTDGAKLNWFGSKWPKVNDRLTVCLFGASEVEAIVRRIDRSNIAVQFVYRLHDLEDVTAPDHLGRHYFSTALRLQEFIR